MSNISLRMLSYESAGLDIPMCPSRLFLSVHSSMFQGEQHILEALSTKAPGLDILPHPLGSL